MRSERVYSSEILEVTIYTENMRLKSIKFEDFSKLVQLNQNL